MGTLTGIIGSQRQALDLVGLARSSWQYRMKPRERVKDPVPQAQRAYASRVSPADRDRIRDYILAGWARGESVDHSFASAWDQGVMLASRRTWWRVAQTMQEQMLRPQVPTKKGARTPREKPVLEATGPGQVWSWDITDLYTPWWGRTFKAYKITDIFSRQIVGYRVEEREADHLAVEMFQVAIRQHGPPEVVHADSGAAMKSGALREALAKHGIDLSFNRPYVSNDNPFSEAGFRTMKYRPDYPRIFRDLDEARAYLDAYVPWYNTQHKHSGIALFSPSQVHDGTWKRAWQIRDQSLQDYYERHPERFRNRPITPTPNSRVGINLPQEDTPTPA